MSDKTVKVPNISCGHCVATVKRELAEIDGVEVVSAAHDTKEVRVEWDDGRTTWEAIASRLEEIHYPAAG